MKNLMALLVVAVSAFIMAPGGCGSASPPPAHGGDGGEGEGEGNASSGEGEGAGSPAGEGEGAGSPAGEGEGAGSPAGEGEGEGPPPPPANADCPNVPLANNACLPPCGNDKFVGQPCTKGGNECAGHNFFAGEATFCTLDWSANAALAMCTKPCSADSDCGNDAVCTSDPNDPGGSKGCVPTACTTAP